MSAAGNQRIESFTIADTAPGALRFSFCTGQALANFVPDNFNYLYDAVVNVGDVFFLPPTRESIFRAAKPQSIRVDIGPEFISASLNLWAYFSGVQLDFSSLGKRNANVIVLRGTDRDFPFAAS
jgi:hypothetical protein